MSWVVTHLDYRTSRCKEVYGLDILESVREEDHGVDSNTNRRANQADSFEDSPSLHDIFELRREAVDGHNLEQYLGEMFTFK